MDHVNEQNKPYWIDKFQDNGYYHDMNKSNTLQILMMAHNVPDWITDNIMVFRRIDNEKR